MRVNLQQRDSNLSNFLNILVCEVYYLFISTVFPLIYGSYISRSKRHSLISSEIVFLHRGLHYTLRGMIY